MGNYNEELVKAGVMVAGEGLHPSSKGVRVRFSGDERSVVDGPFAETKELLAGFWLWEVRDLDEAIEWAKRAPMGGDTALELRPVFEVEDFGDELTPELREQEERLRRQTEEQLVAAHRERARPAPRRRGGLADRVRQADRRPHPHGA